MGNGLRNSGPWWKSSKFDDFEVFKYNIRKVDLSMLLDDNNSPALTALFALLNFLFLIFYKIMDTFVYIVYSSPEFVFCLYCT